MSADGQQRAADRIRDLADRGLDLVSFWQACAEILAVQVPHLGSPCWYSLDPASLLITSHVQAGLPELPAEWLEQEYLADDVHKLADVARSPAGISTLHDVTGGDPTTTLRWHENMRYGGDQELIAALRLPRGSVWGAVGLYREPGTPRFSEAELGFVRRVSVDLARGARRALLYGHATDPDDADPSMVQGLVVIDRQGRTVSMTPGTERWLEQLRLDGEDPARPPVAVRAVAARSLRRAGRSADGDDASARVRAASGGWLTLDGARLESGEGTFAAVIVAPAHPSRISSLLMATYDLTDREQQVAHHVLRGAPTSVIAHELGISVHTVQEHLKNIFAKTDVRSRRDLVASVFFAHYEPRVRDNEQRTAQTRPILGHPVTHRDPTERAASDGPPRVGWDRGA
jgi:DNA-binding CsgD family transcriptional regulator